MIVHSLTLNVFFSVFQGKLWPKLLEYLGGIILGLNPDETLETLITITIKPSRFF